ncbi:TPA: group II intron reverse transcriptase/maturase, partial [Bacillus pseudomycoides]|nr:group II intron reverse transcriptase/maturase [Bacillus pseudomycoides]
ALESIRVLQSIMSRLELTIHKEKSKLVNTWDGIEGFDFLGFHHQKFPKCVKGGKEMYIMAHVPSEKAMKKMRERIKEYTKPRNKLYLQLEDMVKGLNRILQGFKNYYNLSPIGRKWLGKIDWYVLERLNLFWNKKRNIRKKHSRIRDLIERTTYILVKVGS